MLFGVQARAQKVWHRKNPSQAGAYHVTRLQLNSHSVGNLTHSVHLRDHKHRVHPIRRLLNPAADRVRSDASDYNNRDAYLDLARFQPVFADDEGRYQSSLEVP